MNLNNKKLFIFLILILLLSFNVSSIEDEEFKLLGKKGDCIQLPNECATCSYINITSIQYPNLSIQNLELTMTKQGSSFNYTFCSTEELGEYTYCVIGDVDGTDTLKTGCYDFKVTYSGKELSEAEAILYVSFLAILILVFIVNFIGIGMLPSKNSKDEYGRILSINYLKYFRNVLWISLYFLFIGIVYIASNLSFAFLQEELVAKTLFMIFQISFGFAPVFLIVWVVWMFVSMFHDKEFQKMLNRGVFPQGNL